MPTRQPPELAIARIAARQHGVVTRVQLLDAGLGARSIARRTDAGRLHRLHRGVYGVGYAPTDAHARALAAVFACGPRAVLSHRWAAMLWELIAETPRRVEVTSPGSRCPRGISAHRSRALTPPDVTKQRGIPVTAPARTLVDLADVLDDRGLARAVNEAQLRRLVRLASSPQRSSARRVGGRSPDCVRSRPCDAPTRSALEDAFLAFVDRHALPRPSVNRTVAGFEVDMLWAEQRLVVELDGHASHERPATFEADRERDAELTAAGFRVLRVTWRRLREHPGREAARLATLLGDGRTAETPHVEDSSRGATRIGTPWSPGARSH